MHIFYQRRFDLVALVPTLCVGMQTDLAYETALEPKPEALPVQLFGSQPISIISTAMLK
jgi:hypothetical protein